MLGWLDQSPDPLAADLDTGRAPRARRSIWVFIFIAIAFTLARSAPQVASTLWFSAAAASLLIALVSGGWSSRTFLALAIMALAAGWFQARINERPSNSLARFIAPDPLAPPPLIRVRGQILESPTQLQPQTSIYAAPRPPAVAFEFDVRAVEIDGRWTDASGRLRARIDANLAQLPAHVRAGSTIETLGHLRPAPRVMNPGEPPREFLSAEAGIIGSFAIVEPRLITSAEPANMIDRARGGLIQTVERLRTSVRRTIAPEASPSQGRALVSAMLLGERDSGGALTEAESAFRRVGLVHVVAISGFNLAVLAWLVLVAIRITGDRGPIEPLICGLVIIIYLVVLPGESSIRRAGLGLLVFMLAEACGRRYDRLTLLGWVAIILLVLKPMDLWSLGYQLSFGVVAALITICPRAHIRLWGQPIRGVVQTPAQRTTRYRVAAFIIDQFKLAITASLVAWAIATPLIAHHTGQFSLVSPIASLLVMPVAALILWLGYACILIGLIAPGVTNTMTHVLGTMGDIALWIVRTIDEWPLACIDLPRLSAVWAAAATLVVVYWLTRAHRRDWGAWLAVLVMSAWLGLAMTIGTRLDRSVMLRVDVLALGEGSCTLVRSGDEAMLIGCGTSSSRPSADDLRRIVRELGAWRIRTVIVPGPAPELWLLLPELIEPLGVRNVLLCTSAAGAAAADQLSPASQLLRTLQSRGLNIRAVTEDDKFVFADAVGHVVADGERGSVIRFAAGPCAILLAHAANHSTVQAIKPGVRRAEAMVLPARLRLAERPDQTIAATGARINVHASGLFDARDVEMENVYLAAVDGWCAIEITAAGRLRLVPLERE